MDAPKHKAGTYTAKPVDWSVSKTKAGLPQVAVLFRYMEDAETQRELVWWGSFKDTVAERTIDTLVLLGLKGPLEALADGAAGRALSFDSQAQIVVEHRPDSTGKVRAGIA